MDCVVMIARLASSGARALQTGRKEDIVRFCRELAKRLDDLPALAGCWRIALPVQRDTILDAARLCGRERDQLERTIEEAIAKLPPPEPQPVPRRDDPVR